MNIEKAKNFEAKPEQPEAVENYFKWRESLASELVGKKFFGEGKKRGCRHDLKTAAGRISYRENLSKFLAENRKIIEETKDFDDQLKPMMSNFLHRLVNYENLSILEFETDDKLKPAKTRDNHILKTIIQQQFVREVKKFNKNKEFLNGEWRIFNSLKLDQEKADKFRRGVLSHIAVFDFFDRYRTPAGEKVDLKLPAPKADAENKVDLISLDGRYLIQVKTHEKASLDLNQEKNGSARFKTRFIEEIDLKKDYHNKEDQGIANGFNDFIKKNQIKDPVCLKITVPHEVEPRGFDDYDRPIVYDDIKTIDEDTGEIVADLLREKLSNDLNYILELDKKENL